MHREMLQLALLIVAAVVAFFVTRAVAAANRDIGVRDAQEWYRRGGEAVAAGRADEAVAAFRRASVRRPGERTYGLSLARTLALTGEAAAARRALMTLRERAPEDPDVNVELARLAAAEPDVPEALRYYANALYASWPPERTAARRGVRMELIRFLARHDERSRALSELLAVTPEIPDDVRHQTEVADLFAAVGDHRRALGHFQRALALAPDDGAALAGAGTAAFRLADYPLARRYLRRTTAAAGEVATMRELVELVLTNDPLAARLGAAERRRRLLGGLDHVRMRLTACSSDGEGVAAEAAGLRSTIDGFQRQLTPHGVIDQDTVEGGLDIISRAEAYAAQHCGPSAAIDRALVLIAQLHGAGAQ